MESKYQQTKSNIARIVFFGPESTGKTTLALKLSRNYNTEWVPEFSRDYLQEKFDKTGKICEISDIKPIVEGQINTENEFASKAKKYLFCDTNPLQTLVYTKVYFPESDFSWLEEVNQNLKYSHYFLTYIDTPWEPDDLRDKPNERNYMYNVFLQELRERQLNFTILKGSLEERIGIVKKTLKAI